jgi:hypothetical protein
MPKLSLGSNIMHPRTLTELSEEMVRESIDIYQFSGDFIKKRNKLFEEQLRITRNNTSIDEKKQQDNFDEILKWLDK